ncbi:MAG: NUDIX domain-containing protein [bacterium]|nr:NUDIX domain-containing protein [bacterium]
MGRVTFGEKHFCSSVWILTKREPKKILLLHHKKLGKWQQPGGHIEKFENPIETAIREAREEAGINISFLSHLIKLVDKEGSFLPVPEFLMEQAIPEYQDVPSHFHLDLQYVVEIDEQKLIQNASESHNIGWFSKKEALALALHADSRVVIGQLLPD